MLEEEVLRETLYSDRRTGTKFISLKEEGSVVPSDCDRISLYKCEMYGTWVNALDQAKT